MPKGRLVYPSRLDFLVELKGFLLHPGLHHRLQHFRHQGLAPRPPKPSRRLVHLLRGAVLRHLLRVAPL